MQENKQETFSMKFFLCLVAVIFYPVFYFLFNDFKIDRDIMNVAAGFYYFGVLTCIEFAYDKKLTIGLTPPTEENRGQRIFGLCVAIIFIITAIPLTIREIGRLH